MLLYQVKQLEAHNQLCNNFYQMYWNCINYGLFSEVYRTTVICIHVILVQLYNYCLYCVCVDLL